MLIYGGTVVLYLAARGPGGRLLLGRWELLVAVLALVWLLIALMVLVAPHAARTPIYIVLGLIATGAVFFGLMLVFNREALEVEPVEVEAAAVAVLDA